MQKCQFFGNFYYKILITVTETYGKQFQQMYTLKFETFF